jgi:spore coat polysaccharide biosynthesis predicted glycosyltransferase SpsG
MGLPAILIVLADNQRPVAEELDRAEVCLNMGWFQGFSEQHLRVVLADLLDDESRRQAMSIAGRKLVDGLGSRRVVHTLMSKIRPVRAGLSLE